MKPEPTGPTGPMGATGATGATVRTAGGLVRGRAGDGVRSFLGIPFAAAPFGPRRFGAPEPAEPWDGVRPATDFGPTVPKPPYASPYDTLLPEPVIPGEDCLNLNVWTPEVGAAGLPVLVWVHGGAFANGSGAVPVYDGSAFARDGVVCVTFNYRLGVDGFLHFADGGPVNRGLLDQVAALRWVRDNIAAFGGDPARVTVAGESAGAMSVGCLLAMPAAEGLFARAILQSGAGHHAIAAGTAARIGGILAERLGRPVDRAALAEVPLPELLAAQTAVIREAIAMPDPARWGEVAVTMMAFEPVIDGEELPDLPIRRIAAGSARDVALLAGSNTDEQRLFLVPNRLIDLVDESLLRLVLTGYGADVEPTLEVYRAARPDGSAGELFADVVSDWYYRVPAVRLGEARSGLPSSAGAWLYEFAWPAPGFGGRLGACHALEIGFTFDTLGHEANRALVGADAPQALADRMHGAWVRFVTGGDPGWPRYDVERRPVQVFAVEDELVEDPRPAQRVAWTGIR